MILGSELLHLSDGHQGDVLLHRTRHAAGPLRHLQDLHAHRVQGHAPDHQLDQSHVHRQGHYPDRLVAVDHEHLPEDLRDPDRGL